MAWKRVWPLRAGERPDVDLMWFSVRSCQSCSLSGIRTSSKLTEESNLVICPDQFHAPVRVRITGSRLRRDTVDE